MKHGIVLCAVLLGSAPFAYADRVLTKDGRILSPKKARVEGAGYKFVFENGEIVVPDKNGVQSVEIEGDMSEYVPQNDDEKKKLADGYVKYHGRWLSKPAFEEELRKEFEASKARTAELALHSDWDNAYVKETQHFVFKTDTSPELRDYYAELLEAYYALMDERIGIEPTLSMRRTKMAVNVYKSYEEFHQLANPGNPAVIGFFNPGLKSLNFFHDYQEPGLTNWVALHECTHLLTYLIDQQYVPQIWLNEAVADYYGSSKIERDKKGKLVIRPGELQTDRVLTVQQAIKAGGGAPKTSGDPKDKPAPTPASPVKPDPRQERPDTKLVDLFVLSHDAFDGFQYAHAWSFVYFLNNFENGKYQKAFNKFFKGLYTLEKGLPVEIVDAYGGGTGRGKQVPPDKIREYLFKKCGLKDIAEVEKDWKNYIANIPIAGPEARLKRGLYALRGLRFEEALEDLDAAIEGGIKDPRAWWARGRARAFTGKREEAQQDLEKAVAADPLNAAFRYELSRIQAGRLTLTGRMGGVQIVEKDDEKIDDAIAKKQAGLAMELDPDNDRYREWFGHFQ